MGDEFNEDEIRTLCGTCDHTGTNADGDQCSDCAGLGWY